MLYEVITLSHLKQLEAESIHIIREVAAEFENPVMLYSIGKDSAVMLHLARKAFYPAKPPFPLLQGERNIFHTLREEREVLLQHPYESFATSVERFLQEAAVDPKVRGIKMTLYRTDPRSRIIDFV